MVEYGKIFKCEDCGSIVEVLVDAHEEKVCCDSSKNNEVTVAVGEVQHPMDDDHFIQFVELIVGDERYIKHFKPGDVPKATFTVDADLLAANEAIAREFCNLHGLWASQ